jgi:hypothetical protein
MKSNPLQQRELNARAQYILEELRLRMVDMIPSNLF